MVSSGFYTIKERESPYDSRVREFIVVLMQRIGQFIDDNGGSRRNILEASHQSTSRHFCNLFHHTQDHEVYLLLFAVQQNEKRSKVSRIELAVALAPLLGGFFDDLFIFIEAKEPQANLQHEEREKANTMRTGLLMGLFTIDKAYKVHKRTLSEGESRPLFEINKAISEGFKSGLEQKSTRRSSGGYST